MTRRPNNSSTRDRGSALLTTMLIGGVMLMFVAGLMLYASQQRSRAIASARGMTRLSCAEAGLQLARNFFGRNVPQWNTFLSNPSTYDPVAASWITTAGLSPANPRSSALQLAHPELFADLDGDGSPDVYIYVRDNADELPPAVNNPMRDNDLTVIVGAVCISSTMLPRLGNGQQDPTLIQVEGLLGYSVAGDTYQGQGFGGASGTGNLN
jgi:hypothetical protein